jgi:hypothetical protein
VLEALNSCDNQHVLHCTLPAHFFCYGLQAVHDLLNARLPPQQSPRQALLQRAAAATARVHELRQLQQFNAAALSALPAAAQALVEGALRRFPEQAELLLQQQAAQLKGAVIPAVKAEVRVAMSVQ